MTSTEDIIFQAEIHTLRDVVHHRGWEFKARGDRDFFLGLPAHDGSWFFLLVDCHGYPGQPPAWHWSDESGTKFDEPKNAPKGTAFLHSRGRICAPWNRLAYTSVDPKGPHGDWELANWVSPT